MQRTIHQKRKTRNLNQAQEKHAFQSVLRNKIPSLFQLLATNSLYFSSYFFLFLIHLLIDFLPITLGGKRKVMVSTFKGKLLINIREFYEDRATGEEKPGNKGIALSLEQWNSLKGLVSHSLFQAHL